VNKAALAVAVPLLAVLTACGSESDSATDKPTTTASASAAEQLTPALRLAGSMVTAAEVDGYTVQKPDEEYLFARSPEEVTLDKPACAPLAYALNQLPLGTPQATLTRALWSKTEGLNAPYTYITLTAYSTGGAESAMTGLTKAIRSCGDGFTAKASGGSTSPYDSVAPEQVTPAGDESLGFKTTMTVQGTSHTLHNEVVRDGDLIAVYFTVDGMAIAHSRPSDPKLPKAVVTAQNGKLG
jgi:hypothetical protein